MQGLLPVLQPGCMSCIAFQPSSRCNRCPPLWHAAALPYLQKKITARDDASLAREKGALAAATELEERVAAFDAKEKKALRVGAVLQGCCGCGQFGGVAGIVCSALLLLLLPGKQVAEDVRACSSALPAAAGAVGPRIGAGGPRVQAGAAAC